MAPRGSPANRASGSPALNVLVTGSAGYLASLILPRLAADRGIARLVGLDVRAPRAAPERFVHRAGSVLDPGLETLFASEKIDLLIHLAWIFNPSHDREAMRRVDVDGTANVMRAALLAGVAHVIYLSSTTSYGAHPDNPDRLLESHPTRGTPDFAYSADKAQVERDLEVFTRENPSLGVTRLRACIVLGQGTDNFVRAILDLPILLRVLGHDPAMQFLHEDDLANCIEHVVRTRPRGVFNIAPPDSLRFTELARLMERPMIALPGALLKAFVALAWSLRLFPAPAPYIDFVTWPWVADTTRMRDELKFLPRHTTRDAILATRKRG